MLHKKASEIHHILSKEEKKQEHGCERYRNLPEKERQKIVEFEKNNIT